MPEVNVNYLLQPEKILFIPKGSIELTKIY